MAIQVGGTTVIDNSRNITGTSLTVDGNLTKPVLGVLKIEDPTNYTRTAESDAVFGGTFTYTKIDNTSDVHVILHANCLLENTGTDNDIRATLGMGVRTSTGTYVQQVNASANVGVLNASDNGYEHYSSVTLNYVTDGTSDTYSNQVWIRPYGGLTPDATSGYAGSLTLQNACVTFIEVSA